MRLYTRGLPAPIAQRRVDEIDADLHDHIAHERAAGTSDRRIALGLVSRMTRGLAADAAWRERQAKLVARASSTENTVKSTRTLRRSAARVALGVAIVLSLPLGGMLVSGGVVWSLADFALSGILLTTVGVALELGVRRAGSRATAIGIAAAGVAAAILGGASRSSSSRRSPPCRRSASPR